MGVKIALSLFSSYTSGGLDRNGQEISPMQVCFIPVSLIIVVFLVALILVVLNKQVFLLVQVAVGMFHA
jgi:hypothetical protein